LFYRTVAHNERSRVVYFTNLVGLFLYPLFDPHRLHSAEVEEFEVVGIVLYSTILRRGEATARKLVALEAIFDTFRLGTGVGGTQAACPETMPFDGAATSLTTHLLGRDTEHFGRAGTVFGRYVGLV
jgi:hypothetical protein